MQRVYSLRGEERRTQQRHMYSSATNYVSYYYQQTPAQQFRTVRLSNQSDTAYAKRNTHLELLSAKAQRQKQLKKANALIQRRTAMRIREKKAQAQIQLKQQQRQSIKILRYTNLVSEGITKCATNDGFAVAIASKGDELPVFTNVQNPEQLLRKLLKATGDQVVRCAYSGIDFQHRQKLSTHILSQLQKMQQEEKTQSCVKKQPASKPENVSCLEASFMAHSVTAKPNEEEHNFGSILSSYSKLFQRKDLNNQQKLTVLRRSLFWRLLAEKERGIAKDKALSGQRQRRLGIQLLKQMVETQSQAQSQFKPNRFCQLAIDDTPLSSSQYKVFQNQQLVKLKKKPIKSSSVVKMEMFQPCPKKSNSKRKESLVYIDQLRKSAHQRKGEKYKARSKYSHYFQRKVRFKSLKQL